MFRLLSLFGLLVLTFFAVSLVNGIGLEAGQSEGIPLSVQIAAKGQKPGSETTPKANKALDIRILPQEGELLLTDPSGQKLGQDPFTKTTYQEIPQAYYKRGSIPGGGSGPPGPKSASIYLGSPASGQYRLQVFGVATGSYNLEVIAYDQKRAMSKVTLTNIAIKQGGVNHFVIDYSNEPGAQIEVRQVP